MFWGNATALKFVTSEFVVLFLISLIAVTMPLMYVFKKKKRFKQWDFSYTRCGLIRGKKHREAKITETYWSLTFFEALESTRHNPKNLTRLRSYSLSYSNPSCNSNGSGKIVVAIQVFELFLFLFSMTPTVKHKCLFSLLL